MKVSFFEKTTAALGQKLQEAALDHEAFERRVSVCDLKDCRATCCFDGVVLSEEEAVILREIEEPSIVQQDGNWRTKIREAKKSELSQDFPEGFPETRCVFLDEKHRCRLQIQAVKEDRHPWFYKPISCWMHPVMLIRREDGREILTLPDAQNDPRQINGRSFGVTTPCGCFRAAGMKAKDSLMMELKALGEISGRNLLGELNAPSLDEDDVEA